MRKAIAILMGLCLAGAALAETDYPSKQRFKNLEARATVLEAEQATAVSALSGSDEYAVAFGSVTNAVTATGKEVIFATAFSTAPVVVVTAGGTNGYALPSYVSAVTVTNCWIHGPVANQAIRYVAVGVK